MRGTIKHKIVEYTEESVQKVLNAQYMPRAKYITNNLFIFPWESDYAAMTLSGYWYEVEIKVSFADFKNDFTHKAEKYRILMSGLNNAGHRKPRPHFFSYAVPEEMVEKVRPLIPSYAGLIGISTNGFMRLVVAPTMLHKIKYTEEDLRLTDKFYYNFIEYKNKYNAFSRELAKYRKEINSVKAEFKAVTGKTFKSYLKDAL